jgi:predicted nuclease of predicted toxin-antitoxin system
VKILLDENLPHQLRRYLKLHQVYTTAGMGWSGWQNGDLLSVAEKNGFDVFLTGDLSIEYQQNLAGRKISIVSLSTQNWRIVKPYAQKIADAVDLAKPGTITKVDCGRFYGHLMAKLLPKSLLQPVRAKVEAGKKRRNHATGGGALR